MPEIRSKRIERPGHALQALTQHLAALAEGGGGELLEHRRVDPLGLGAGTIWTTAEATLGGGMKALRWTAIAILASHRHCAAIARRP